MSDLVADDIGFVGSGTTGPPCSGWATLADVTLPEGTTIDDVDTDHLEEWLQFSNWLLYVLSGRQFSGECSATIRPSLTRSTRTIDALERSLPGPYHCSCSGSLYGCSLRRAFRLPGEPIRTIRRLTLHGEELELGTDFLLLNRRRVLKVEGGWPCCQDVCKAPTEQGTLEVEYTFGQDPPRAGVRASALLAWQLYLSAINSKDCKLPKHLTSISRQEVSMTIVDPFSFLEDGKTGVYSVDLFLAAVNPHHLRRRSGVVSPDIRRGDRVVSSQDGS